MAKYIAIYLINVIKNLAEEYIQTISIMQLVTQLKLNFTAVK